MLLHRIVQTDLHEGKSREREMGAENWPQLCLPSLVSWLRTAVSLEEAKPLSKWFAQKDTFWQFFCLERASFSRAERQHCQVLKEALCTKPHCQQSWSCSYPTGKGNFHISVGGRVRSFLISFGMEWLVLVIGICKLMTNNYCQI